MIEVKNLTKYYGKGESRFKVLDNINLKIAQRCVKIVDVKGQMFINRNAATLNSLHEKIVDCL